ncbi:MAG: hypothetical protein LC781_05090 [Actinobacteria bacterium]|nr:hypothetical protein [Actinomycetota bacterium]
MRVLRTIRLLGPLRDRDVRFLAVDGHDHVPVLVVAEDLGARLLEAFERLGCGVPIGVVRADLDDCYLGLEAVEEERRRGGVGAVMGDLQDREDCQ